MCAGICSRYGFVRWSWCWPAFARQGRNVTAHERSLVECFSTREPHVDDAVAATGFVPLPSGFGVGCEDFNDTACGAASNVNACANNPSPIPTNDGTP